MSPARARRGDRGAAAHAATAERIGVGWVSFYREDFLRDLLAIPAGVRPVAWLCLGPVSRLEKVPDLERHGWSNRRPLHHVRHDDRWGDHLSADDSSPPSAST